MKIKKNTFSTLVLELFFQSIANCKILKIQKNQKSTAPNAHPFCIRLLGERKLHIAEIVGKYFALFFTGKENIKGIVA
jgi:hypothetical protein